MDGSDVAKWRDREKNILSHGSSMFGNMENEVLVYLSLEMTESVRQKAKEIVHMNRLLVDTDFFL